MDDFSRYGEAPFSSLDEADVVRVIQGLPSAVATLGTDGAVGYVNERAMELFARLKDPATKGPLVDAGWDLIDPDSNPIAMHDYPTIVTGRTGEEFENVEVGFPGIDRERVWLRVSTRRLDDGDPPHRVIVALVDVTVEHDALADLGIASQMVTQAFDNAPLGTALLGMDGRWLRVNQAFCDLLGYTEEELLAMTLEDVTHPDDLAADLAGIEAARAGIIYQATKRYMRSDGRHVWAEVTAATVVDQFGKPLYMIGQIQDMTERRRLEKRLHELADHDYLTGLLNRRRFAEELDRQLERCSRHGEHAAVMLLDVDQFKSVNDSGGHAAGDALLKKVADVCERRVRGSDLVARVGGDEFAAILVESDEAGALEVAHSLGRSIRDIERSVQSPRVTASIGLTVMRPGDKPDTVMGRADRALYAVKKSGRDGVCLDDSLGSGD